MELLRLLLLEVVVLTVIKLNTSLLLVVAQVALEAPVVVVPVVIDLRLLEKCLVAEQAQNQELP
jgi:hypothetical protein